jgi:hypothetical protein
MNKNSPAIASITNPKKYPVMEAVAAAGIGQWTGAA